MKNKLKFRTRAIHSGNKADVETGAVIPALNLTSTFKLSSKLLKFIKVHMDMFGYFWQ